jgi:hypothetical protein
MVEALPPGISPDAYNNAGSVLQPQPAPESETAAGAPRDEEAMLYCPVCATKLESRKCKLFCAQCGYYMSCADYY